MAVKQTILTCQCFKKKDGKKDRSYYPIHRTDAHDLTECKVMRGIIDQELGERKYKHDDDGKDGATTDQLALGYQQANHMVHHIFGGTTTYSSNREYKNIRSR